MKRLLVTLILFVAVAALALLLPASLPGEMSSAAMTSHASPACTACPPVEQLVAAGMVAGDGGWYVNVLFAAPPFNARLRLAFDDLPQAIDLQQTGTAWHVAAGRAGPMVVTSVAQRDGRVVFGLPAELRTRGLSVTTASGDRIPVTGSIAPQYPAGPHFNATDVVLIAILALTSWAGYRRGVLTEAASLAAMVLSIVIAVIAYRPLAAWLADLTGSPRTGAALGSGSVVLMAGFASLAAVPGVLKSFRASVSGMNDAMAHGLGAIVAPLRQLIVLAMLVTIGADAAVLHWAANSIDSSLFGSTLLHAWRALFSIG
jgi:uncharacterized membrane protein required for colicin V production